MGNDKGGAPLHQSVHAVLHQLLGTSINGRGSLVQNQGRRVRHSRTGNGQQLALPLAQVSAVPGEHGLIAVRQPADEAVGVGQLGRLDALFIGGVQLAIADVIHHSAGKQVGVLEHNSQRPAEIRLFDFVDVDAVVPDFAVGNVVKAVNQVGDGGFSCAGGADKGNFLTRLGIKADVVEYYFVFAVAKVHMVQHHAPFQLGVGDGAGGFVGVFPSPEVGAGIGFGEPAVFVHLGVDQFHIAIIGFGGLVHQLKHTLGAGGGVYHKVHLLAHLGDGVGKALIQPHKGDHRADGNSR